MNIDIVAILATLTTVTLALPFRVEGLFTRLLLVILFDIIPDISIVVVPDVCLNLVDH